MKHFRYEEIDDFLTKADAYTDIKTVKIFSIKAYPSTGKIVLYAVINLHTSAIDYKNERSTIINPGNSENNKLVNQTIEEDMKELVSRLRASGFKKGGVIETAPQRIS